MSISKYMKFHFQTFYKLQESWSKTMQHFGKSNLIHSHQLGNRLISLYWVEFPKIEDYINKFKLLMLQLGDSGTT